MFKIGQKVVCKDLSDTNTHYPHGIEKGKIYTVNTITKCSCGRELLILDEAIPYYGRECNSCFSKVHELAFCSFRFEPIKMYNCLSRGGRLVCITSESWVNGTQKKQIEFKNWLDDIEAEVIDIGKGAFKESGTTVGGKIVVINKEL
jgi:hypothetical protein